MLEFQDINKKRKLNETSTWVQIEKPNKCIEGKKKKNALLGTILEKKHKVIENAFFRVSRNFGAESYGTYKKGNGHGY